MTKGVGEIVICSGNRGVSRRIKYRNRGNRMSGDKIAEFCHVGVGIDAAFVGVCAWSGVTKVGGFWN